MAKTSKASTQKFTEIKDIIDSIVFFESGDACMVIEVSSTNFSLLSIEEQQSKIAAYASFLNSLTFTVEILVNSRRVDISSYISLLEQEINTITDPRVMAYMQGYKAFIQVLVKENIVLDKRFYISVPYSYLEAGALKTVSSGGKGPEINESMHNIKITLTTKADSVRNQLGRLNLQTKLLTRDELIHLFHDMYNPQVITSTA